MKKFLALFMAAAMVLAMVACGNGGNNANSGTGGNNDQSSTGGNIDGDSTGGAVTLKIGGIGPLTGGVAIYGNATYWGAQVAVDEINAMQSDIRIEYKYEDDEGDNEKAINAYRSLQDWEVDVIYGCTTSAPCVAVAGETFADRYFQLTPSASSTDVTAGRDNVFQICFTDPNQGVTAAKYIAENKMAAKIAVIYNNADPYSTGIYEAFAAEAPNQGLEVVSVSTFSSDENVDFSVQVRDAQSSGAELVFLPIYYTPASNILKQAKDIGYAPKFFGADGMDGILTMAGFDLSLAEGLMLMTPFNAYATDERTVTFIDSYKKLSGGVEPNQFAADGYDCVYAIYEAAKKAGISDGMSHEDICAALISAFTDSGFSVDGLTGSGMVWNTNGEVSKEPVAVVIENGAYVNM
ncbi:MAG: ABC transporter substrate-binding protein [Oscillospiraceae bacterium]|jgi:branched-chain amino acid transport system substrate-binding protein|nr:ABC transporter substrate-binding protein [Oscillospiraceae bacterium]